MPTNLIIIATVFICVGIVAFMLGHMHGRSFAAATKEAKAQALKQLVNDAIGAEASWLDAYRSVLPIIQFAVENLDPTTVRGWPHGKLLLFATSYKATVEKLLKATPGEDRLMQEQQLMLELTKFANEAKAAEAARGPRLTGVGHQTLAQPTDWGPQTPEAKKIWSNVVPEPDDGDNGPQAA